MCGLYTGGEREDISHMVVLDGLLTPSERTSLLDWLTAPGHDHSGPPPEDKWERACADTEGDAASWGLRPHVLQALEVRVRVCVCVCPCMYARGRE